MHQICLHHADDLTRSPIDCDQRSQRLRLRAQCNHNAPARPPVLPRNAQQFFLGIRLIWKRRRGIHEKQAAQNCRKTRADTPRPRFSLAHVKPRWLPLLSSPHPCFPAINSRPPRIPATTPPPPTPPPTSP